MSTTQEYKEMNEDKDKLNGEKRTFFAIAVVLSIFAPCFIPIYLYILPFVTHYEQTVGDDDVQSEILCCSMCSFILFVFTLLCYFPGVFVAIWWSYKEIQNFTQKQQKLGDS